VPHIYLTKNIIYVCLCLMGPATHLTSLHLTTHTTTKKWCKF